ncbi:unnamed protein product, partial [Didymodactylos carnosus]
LLIDQTNVDQQISISNVNVDSNRQVYEQCQSNLNSNELIWLQFYVEQLDQIKKITKYLTKIYRHLREDSILIGVLPSSTVGRCFVRMKDDEKFRPIIIDGIEYPHDLKLKK